MQNLTRVARMLVIKAKCKQLEISKLTSTYIYIYSYYFASTVTNEFSY